MITRRKFLATTAVTAIAACAEERLGLTATQQPENTLASTLAPATQGKLTDVARNRTVYQSSSADDDHTGHLVTDGSTQTFWKPLAKGQQWISIDLGRSHKLARLTIRWGDSFAQSYQIEVSSEETTPTHWTAAHSTTDGKGGVEEIPLHPVSARHIRLTGEAGQAGFSVLSLEAYSKEANHVVPVAKQVAALSGTAFTEGWYLQAALFARNVPEQIASPACSNNDWIPAIVPATVLSSYLAAGAIPDPYFGNQVTQLSDGFFSRNDFWYRNRFTIAPECKGRRLWLVFEGINWKSDVYCNEHKIGQIDGSFIRRRFDITELAICGGVNCIAVLVRQVAHPGEVQHKVLKKHYRNGGILGLDSPTFVSSIGWNWVPTIPGRNTGIWNHVSFETSGEVVLSDPWVTTDVLSEDLSHAELAAKTEIRNISDRPMRCKLHLAMENASVDHELELQARETRQVSIDKSIWAALAIQNPRLWWPNGYGEPALHAMHFRLEASGTLSDEKTVSFGIRKLTYQTGDGSLHLSVNGHRILCRGGNWGMDDGMLRCDRDGYDLRVGMHRDANLNMIRNWVGMVGRDEFYQACDRYGVLIWDDFWLANPGDGPNPTDHEMFMRNARDKVLRYRHHASLALYCGRNEGLPPADLDEGMRSATEQLDGTRFYIPASDRGLVTGHGPYENQDPEWYFANRGATFHSEQGIVCVPPVESMRAMMPERDLWPISDMWAVHDYQEPRSPLYTQRIEQRYGKPQDIEDYCRKSQLVNLETAKAIFECLQSRQGGGQLLWMSQSAWPCLICQLYDYYFDQTAAFFGAKTACEPVHILWDQASNLVRVANNTVTDRVGLRAEAWVHDFDGREQWHQAKELTVPHTSAQDCFPLSIPSHLDRVRFIRLQLMQGNAVLSSNFYWSAATPGDCTALNTLQELSLSVTVHARRADNQHTITVTVSNPNPAVALAVRLTLLHGQLNERVLPAFYEDNYFSLVSHHEKTVHIQVASGVLRGETPRLSVTGWNVKPATMTT